MKKLTNYAPGPRGIVLKKGDTVWLAPGETAEVDMDNVVKPLPDLGTQPDATDDDRVSALETRLAELQDENAALRAQLEAGNGPTGGHKTADLPALTGKNKAELLAIAKAEEVEIEDGATNDDIRSAIELKREAAAD